MSNVTIEKKSSDKSTAATAREWGPGRLLSELFRWDPFAEMFAAAAEENSKFVPAFEVRESKDAFTFKADVPGVKEADIEVKLANNRLTISGKRDEEKSEKSDTCYTYERRYGSFTRSFTLPEGVDSEKIKAELKNGVLCVELPKSPGSEAKKIAIKAA